MFNGASDFNNGIPTFTTKVLDMSGMFQGALKFNNMFNAANKFNQGINGWTVTNTGTGATTKETTAGNLGMVSMFQSAQNFNQDVNGWTPTACVKFENMFNGASRFDGNMFTSTSAALTFESMFAGA